MREADRVKDKSYRRYPIGGEVGKFLRTLRWAEASHNTINTYEIVLRRLALDHLDLELRDLEPPLVTERVREFLDRHWGDASAATRRNRLHALRSFFRWAVEEGRISANPTLTIKAPRGKQSDRKAHPRALIQQIIAAQPTLRDQVAIQLLARLGLRRNELRLLRVEDIDLTAGLLTVQGKGNKRAIMPIGFKDLQRDLYLHISGEGRKPDEYLLYPQYHRTRPMNQASVHRWFKKCLERAGAPDLPMHELRHSAGDEIWRVTGDIVKAQQLLRHESIATTQIYLHPNQDDLTEAMKAVDDAWEIEAGE
jgi:integrase/recombinase XerC